MKYVLLLCFALLFGNRMQAQETAIYLSWYGYFSEDGAPLQHQIKDDRSLTLSPYATHNGSIVFIYVDKALDNMTIKVEDAAGNICYVETVCIPSGGSYSFVLPEGIPVGETLKLVLETEMGIYEGEFSLSK